MKKLLLCIVLTFCITAHAADTTIDVAKQYPHSVDFIGKTLKQYGIEPAHVNIKYGPEWGTYSCLTYHILYAPATWPQGMYTHDLSLSNLETALNPIDPAPQAPDGWPTPEGWSTKETLSTTNMTNVNRIEDIIQKYAFAIGHEATHMKHHDTFIVQIPRSLGFISAFATYKTVSQGIMHDSPLWQRLAVSSLPILVARLMTIKLVQAVEQRADDGVKEDISVLTGGFNYLKDHALYQTALDGMLPFDLHPPSIQRLAIMTKRINRLDHDLACHLVTNFDSQQELELSRYKKAEILKNTKEALLKELGPDLAITLDQSQH